MRSPRVGVVGVALAVIALLAACGQYETSLVATTAPPPISRSILFWVLALAFVVNVVTTIVFARRLRGAPFDATARRSVLLLAIGDVGLLVALACVVVGLATG